VGRGNRWLVAGCALGLLASGALTVSLAAATPSAASTASTASTASAASAATITRPAPGAHGPDWNGERTVTYCDEGGASLSMSLFAPSLEEHPVPAVLQVHGGRWQRGARWTSLSQSETATDLVKAGFVVASIDYRLAPENPWPDQIDDVGCAVRFLRAHAAELGIEPDRIAAWGTSAGGQLVSLLATAPRAEPWNKGPYADESDQVAAVVDEFGPADLTTADWPRSSSDFIRTVFGSLPGSANPVLKAASPVTYVAADDPPFLIIQGLDDQVVPASQSMDFANRLRSVGVPVDLVLVHGGQHGLETPGQTPSPSDISSLITSYLEKLLHT
jgi:acetyl esterase/lipase